MIFLQRCHHDSFAGQSVTSSAFPDSMTGVGSGQELSRLGGDMFLTIALVLAVLWVLCVLLFKVTAAAIHLLLLIAVIAAVAHFVRRRAPPSSPPG
jgi:hypothetical protein